MRTPRKLRPFRPSALSLESICPVSSFATSIPPSARVVADQAGVRPTREQQISVVELIGRSQSNSRRVAATLGVAGSTARSTIPTPALETSNVAGGVNVDIGRYSNPITIASANVPSTRSSAVPTQVQDTGTSGGIIPEVQPAGGGSVVPTSSVTPSSPATNGVGSPDSLTPKIRPMTLAASSASPSAFGPSGTTGATHGNSSLHALSIADSSSGLVSDSGFGSSLASASGSTSGNPLPPTPPMLYISGGMAKDSHDTSDTPVPTAVQGSPWSASLFLAQPSSTSWQILSYTWTFPSGAIKGYGTFQTNTDDPDGPYTVFAGNPTSASNTKVEVQGFSSDDLTNRQGAGINDPDHYDSFYWGPEAQGLQTISVSAFCKEGNTGATATETDSATVNVIRPTGSIILNTGANPNPSGSYYPAFGQTGVSPVGLNSQQWLQLDANAIRNNDATVSGPHGIDWLAFVYPSAQGVMISGQFGVVQTVNYTATRIYSSNLYGTLTSQTAGLLPDGSNPGYTLDTYFPYGGTQAVGTDSSGSTNVLGSSDTPGSPLDGPGNLTTPDSFSRQDYFTMTLLFQPAGGIWIPVGQYTWSWGGSAKYSAGSWGLASGTQSRGSYSASTTFPTWSHNVQEVANTWQ